MDIHTDTQQHRHETDTEANTSETDTDTQEIDSRGVYEGIEGEKPASV